MELLLKIFICFLAGAGAGIGTGFAGMSAAAVIGPMLASFLSQHNGACFTVKRNYFLKILYFSCFTRSSSESESLEVTQ